MPLDGATEMQRIIALVGGDNSRVIGVEIDALAGGQTLIRKFNNLEGTVSTALLQAGASASDRIFQAFGNQFGVNVANAERIVIKAHIGSDVSIKVDFRTPDELTSVNWNFILGF